MVDIIIVRLYLNKTLYVVDIIIVRLYHKRILHEGDIIVRLYLNIINIHDVRCPRDATTGARGRYDEHVAMMAMEASRWRPDLVLVVVYSVYVLWRILQAEVACHPSDLH